MPCTTQVFCFRESSSAAHQGLNRFYNNPEFSDLTILAPDGIRIFVHQIVLASCSKRFSDVLEHGESWDAHCIADTGGAWRRGVVRQATAWKVAWRMGGRILSLSCLTVLLSASSPGSAPLLPPLQATCKVRSSLCAASTRRALTQCFASSTQASGLFDPTCHPATIAATCSWLQGPCPLWNCCSLLERQQLPERERATLNSPTTRFPADCFPLVDLSLDCLSYLPCLLFRLPSRRRVSPELYQRHPRLRRGAPPGCALPRAGMREL